MHKIDKTATTKNFHIEHSVAFSSLWFRGYGNSLWFIMSIFAFSFDTFAILRVLSSFFINSSLLQIRVINCKTKVPLWAKTLFTVSSFRIKTWDCFLCFIVNTFASLPRTIRGLPLIVSAKSDGSTLLYCNGNSVYIRDIEVAFKIDYFIEIVIYRMSLKQTFTRSMQRWQLLPDIRLVHSTLLLVISRERSVFGTPLNRRTFLKAK